MLEFDESFPSFTFNSAFSFSSTAPRDSAASARASATSTHARSASTRATSSSTDVGTELQ